MTIYTLTFTDDDEEYINDSFNKLKSEGFGVFLGEGKYGDTTIKLATSKILDLFEIRNLIGEDIILKNGFILEVYNDYRE